MSKTLFHYTPVFHAVMILRDSVIRRSSGKTPPYVWLSSNPTNEPTANRAVLSPEQFRQCDAHMLGAFQRQARFVFHDGCVATPWADLRLPSAERRNLKVLAKRKGGRPEEWFTWPDDVPCRDLRLELETLEGRWQEIEQDDLKRRYEDLEVTLDDNGKVKQLQTRWRG
jgi:hypothetical protein